MNLFSHFKNNLRKTSNLLSSNILNSFKNKKIDAETLEELESVLISADISMEVVSKLIDSIKKIKNISPNITNIVLETLAIEIENSLLLPAAKLAKYVFSKAVKSGSKLSCW